MVVAVVVAVGEEGEEVERLVFSCSKAIPERLGHAPVLFAVVCVQLMELCGCNYDALLYYTIKHAKANISRIPAVWWAPLWL